MTGLLVVAVSVFAAGCGGAAQHPVADVDRSPSAAVSTTTSKSATPTPRPDPTPSVIAVPPPPGSLRQTRAFPSASTTVFGAEMTDLWDAVVTGNADPAVQAFFPLSAYEQVKAIADPAADWRSRLLGGFRLDVTAAHRYVGRGATLVRVIVPSAQAAWIDPGVCYNSVGYWHVAGSRIVYRQRGQLRSIGIASLISWRGRWYVVHFGTVLRNGSYGVVDAPSAGTGMPGPPGGC